MGMKNSFSLLAFLCKVPVELLEEYAESVGLNETLLGSCIPWLTIDALEADRRSMAVVRQAIVEAPEALRDRIMQDFMDVDALADGRGIEYLLITGRCQQPEPVDLALHLSHYAGSHAKALFALLEFPEVFQRALRFAHVESFGESRWHKTGRIDGAQPQVTERSLEQLRLAISNYCRLQGRGTGCTVDVEDRGDDLYVFVYPEDYARRRMVYNAQHDLIVETFRPAFEVIYVYHRPTQTLEIYVGGVSRDREALKRYFGRAILGVELGFWSGARRVYQLEHLKYATCTFPIQPTDEVVAVRLKRLSFLDTAGAETREITLASRCEQNPNDLYEDVRIWTVGEPVVKNFQELGLANTRNGRPTKAWQLLREFAGHEGVYDPSHPSVLYAPEKIERRGIRQPLTAFSGKLGTALSDLAGHLSKLFPVIPGRPVAEYDPRKHQYRAAVRLSWEPGYRQRKTTEYTVRQ